MSGNTPKSMSNRLMTMKVGLQETSVAKQLLIAIQFMQRSAAKNVASSPTTPKGPASKKVRLSNGSSAAADQQILQSALAEEAKKQQEAYDKAAQYTGETKWVLSYTDPLEGKRGDALNVRQAGFAELDAEDSDDEDDELAQPIRKQYGGGVQKKADVCSRQAALVLTCALTSNRNLRLRQLKALKASQNLLPKMIVILMTRPPSSYARRSAKCLLRNASRERAWETRRREEHPDL